jgi:NTP pyrophosphatase (non-canonical NTP hydrolase)
MIEHEQLYKDAIKKWGEDLQLFCFYEEVGELMQAISKFKRRSLYPNESITGYYHNIREELVDVQIMLDQLKVIYGYDEELEKEKIERLKRFVYGDGKIV